MKRVLALILILIFTSCEGNSYHKVSGGEFNVCFSDQNNLSIATDLAQYWKDNDLITEDKQDIGLFREEGLWIVKLIAVDPKVEMTFSERRLLTEFQKELSEKVFKGAPVAVQISNNKFETLYDINS